MSEFPIQPLFDRVFVKKDEDKLTKSGFHLPETVKGRAKTGTVVAVGHGWFNPTNGETIPLKVKVGDRVFIAEFDGHMIDYEGERVWIFRENEIIGLLKE
jgi:chaperonin GroES